MHVSHAQNELFGASFLSPKASHTDSYTDNRLIHEKDVLSGILCEYVDDNSKKDIAFISNNSGTILMTTYRFQFIPNLNHLPQFSQILHNLSHKSIQSYFLVPLACIASIKRKQTIVEIVTKDLRHLHFRFDSEELTKIYSVLNTYVFPEKISYLFAFYHALSASRESADSLRSSAENWDIYNDSEEYSRQGAFDHGKWRMSSFNSEFQHIETYPERIVVPFNVPDEVLVEATMFRSLGRIPNLSWIHRSNGASLTRSSQPKVGVSKCTSPADESLVASIAASGLLPNALQIMDCRPMSNALANRAKGYGVESSVDYKNCKISFLNIPNIHSMRESMRKLRALCCSTQCDNLQWLGNIEETRWLIYVRQLLRSSLQVAHFLLGGESVLLHCSHGWDRTSQIAALTQLFLDPFFRTWKGFQILIEKEWLSFGHPFQLRLSHGIKADTQESPIFIQFLDCVWQLLRLFPSHFEFNEGLLLLLLNALYSCRFGTFLMDCVKVRKETNLANRTASVWTYVDGFRLELSEPSYEPDLKLLPPIAGLLKNVCLWESYFLRYCMQPLIPRATQPPVALVEMNEKRIATWQLPLEILSVLHVGNSVMARKLMESETLTN